MTLKIFPYKLGSLSAKRLARALRVLRVSHNYNAKRSDVIINSFKSNEDQLDFMDSEIRDLIQTHKVTPSDILILTNNILGRVGINLQISTFFYNL